MASHCAYSRKMRLDYDWLEQETIGTIGSETDLVANTANISSLVYRFLNALHGNTINWCGFYLTRMREASTAKVAGDQEQATSSGRADRLLVLGPFQGKVACKRIEFGSGVCGTAAARKQTVIVPDVHRFEGHIACDADSNSEIVVPIVRDGDGEVLGVLDIDSNQTNTFNDEDRCGLERVVRVLARTCEWNVQ
jgi:L-methionine (R)-S-oxide reductase